MYTIIQYNKSNLILPIICYTHGSTVWLYYYHKTDRYYLSTQNKYRNPYYTMITKRLKTKKVPTISIR